MSNQKQSEPDKNNAGRRQGLREQFLWIDQLERTMALAIPVHPDVISGVKLFVIVPLFILALKQIGPLSGHPWIVIVFFLSVGLFDYLNSTIARYKGMKTVFSRGFDRVSDYVILVAVAAFCFDVLPAPFLIVKLSLDFVLIVLFVMGRSRIENRVQLGINYAALLALLIVSQGWEPRFMPPKVVISLLWINMTLSAIVILYNLHILQKRFIADVLSGGNLLCGIFSMFFASQDRIDISLLYLMLGAAFDGFDGAAARKFGGTRLGVYSDDIADGVNYGIALGVALYFVLGGVEGLVVGGFYILFTISRLVYFTLNKAYSDPNYFCGVPSTVGALVTLCSLILFKHHLVIAGLMVGIACIQMVSFDTHYRHLGRSLASNRRIIYGMPVMIVLLMTGNFFWGKNAPVMLILGGSLIYGFIPTIANFADVLGKDKEIRDA